MRGESDEGFYLADLEETGRVGTDNLAYNRRIACLSDYGLLLMLQRLVFAYTREIVDTATLMKVTKHVLEEAALLEEWNEQVIPTTDGPAVLERLLLEGAEFDRLLSRVVSDGSGRSYTLREDLRDPSRRPAVRRAVVAAIRERKDQLDVVLPSDEAVGQNETT